METLKDFENWLDMYYFSNPNYNDIKISIGKFREIKESYTKDSVSNVFLVKFGGQMITTAISLENFETNIYADLIQAIDKYVSNTNDPTELNNEMQYGNYFVYILRGTYCYLAIIMNSKVPDDIISRGAKIHREIEKRYSTLLPKWNGQKGYFTGLDVYLKKYMVDYKKQGT